MSEAVKEVMVCGDYSTASESRLLGSKPCSASSGCVTLSQSLNLSVSLSPICKVKKNNTSLIRFLESEVAGPSKHSRCVSVTSEGAGFRPECDELTTGSATGPVSSACEKEDSLVYL